MPICVAVLDKDFNVNQLESMLSSKNVILKTCELIQPCTDSGDVDLENIQVIKNSFANCAINLRVVEIKNVFLLNPKLQRKIMQKNMARWLMPFGFITGLAFTEMTGLNTFNSLGFGDSGEKLIGGLLGMLSGLIGSQFAATSVNPDKNDDLRILRKKNKEGNWLLLLETPIEIELPWLVIQEINPIEIIRISDV